MNFQKNVFVINNDDEGYFHQKEVVTKLSYSWSMRRTTSRREGYYVSFNFAPLSNFC